MTQKTNYGLVNVRTDCKTIMCATLNETEEKWVVDNFQACCATLLESLHQFEFIRRRVQVNEVLFRQSGPVAELGQ